ncbi:hypothetical protein [Streptomyces catenulae]|uniref:Secreted protein n=1 Tax=Streptomyces catenulae TaxID=66875 RepID=A0ABV2YU90_9ACTN
MNRVLSLSGRVTPQRRMAVFGYGLLTTAVAYSGLTAAAGGTKVPKQTVRADTATTSVDAEAGVYQRQPASGYIPTYFDGHGGIAGVPMTDEQRKALSKEAVRRGMSKSDADALAYGDELPEGAAASEAEGRTGQGNAPTAMLYREVAPSEGTDRAAVADEEGKADRKAPAAPSRAEKLDPRATANAGPTADKRRGGEESVGEIIKHEIGELLPESVKDLVDHLAPFRSYMAAISQPGTEAIWEVSEPHRTTGDVTIEATSQVSESISVSVEVTASDSVKRGAEVGPSVSVTVTDPATDEVLVEPEPEQVDVPEDASRVAIGSVVEAVVAASVDEYGAVEAAQSRRSTETADEPPSAEVATGREEGFQRTGRKQPGTTP